MKQSFVETVSAYPPVGEAKSRRLYQIGYWSLFALILMLPFELIAGLTIGGDWLVINNLKLLWYVVLVLAVISLAPSFRALFRTGLNDKTNYFYPRRVALVLLGALIVVCLVSGLLSNEKGEGVKWTWQIVLGGLTWLVVPLWLQDDPTRKINLLGTAVVSGALVAAVVGFLEFILGRGFAESMIGWFKYKPTEAGPFLRLSGTFDYANVAAMYFELALPFAIVGLARTLAQKQWLWVVFWAGSIGILLEALLLTFSRGALVGLAAGVVGLVLVSRSQKNSRVSRKHWWGAIGLSVGMGILVGALTLLLSPLATLRFTSQSDQDWYKARFIGLPPATMSVCEKLTVPVTLENTSPLTWEAGGSKPYNFSYHWLYPGNKIAQFEGIRTQLTRDVSPGGSLLVQAEVRAPEKPGDYLLVWDIAQENVAWFSLKSAAHEQYPVRVNDLPEADKRAACGFSPAEIAAQARPSPKELPEVLQQPNRKELWQAALKMITTHPILGIGPGGYRLNYGTYTEPALLQWDKRVLANSLPLEIFADIGLLGGGLFVAFFVVAGWSLVKLLWYGRTEAPWQVAIVGAIAAFLGHGLLDYFLHSHAIFILFWILFGLAATKVNREGN